MPREEIKRFINHVVTMGALLESYDSAQSEAARNVVELSKWRKKKQDENGTITLNILLDTKKLLDEDVEILDGLSQEWYGCSINDLRQEYQKAKGYLSLYDEFQGDLERLKGAYTILLAAHAFSDDPEEEDSQESYEAAIETLEARFAVVVAHVLELADHWA